MTASESEPTANERAAGWLLEHGDLLFAYAVKRVTAIDQAEDLVQETLLAAISSYSRFAGNATERTWLVGILRNKIKDYYRRQAVERKAKTAREDAAHAEHDFTPHGHWKKTLKKWPTNPEAVMEAKEFWIVLEACCDKLTGPMSAAFRLRELEGLDSPEICEMLNISTTNLSVRLHRARLLLRRCLEDNWFGERK